MAAGHNSYIYESGSGSVKKLAHYMVTLLALGGSSRPSQMTLAKQQVFELSQASVTTKAGLPAGGAAAAAGSSPT
jgi:hypothetical protein